jgi:hypothetical protein
MSQSSKMMMQEKMSLMTYSNVQVYVLAMPAHNTAVMRRVKDGWVNGMLFSTFFLLLLLCSSIQ